MLYYLITVFYVLVCFGLVLVILLQQGKGGDIASAFGGGASQSAFGARSGATVLSRATTVFAILFIGGALVLTIMAQRGPGSVVGGRPGPAQLPAGAALPAPTAPAPAPPSEQTPPPAAASEPAPVEGQ
jgi:preprotein translocase subunit SecG